MALKVLLVDDERLARAQLRNQLAHFPELEIVAEADCVPKAVDAVRDFRPDVVFLDIQMPGESGFDFLEQATGEFKTIFVTAFDRFALRAFEVNALDYLMKPVAVKRLASAVHRLSAPLPAPAKKPLNYSDHLFVSTGTAARFIKVSDIVAITAAGQYSEVFVNGDRKWMLLESMKHWEDRLPAAQFVRTHRSAIVNLDYVDRVAPLGNNTYEVFLRGRATPLPISRRHAMELKNRSRL